MFGYIYLILSVLFNLTGQVLVKSTTYAGVDRSKGLFGMFVLEASQGGFWIGISAFALGYVFYSLALTGHPFGKTALSAQVMTMTGLLVVSALVFHEQITPLKAAALGLMVIAAVMLNT